MPLPLLFVETVEVFGWLFAMFDKPHRFRVTLVCTSCQCTLSDAHCSGGTLILSFVIQRGRNLDPVSEACRGCSCNLRERMSRVQRDGKGGAKFRGKRDSRWRGHPAFPERHQVMAARCSGEAPATCAGVGGEATQPRPELNVVVAAGCTG